MESRISFLQIAAMEKRDAFIEGLRIVFARHPELIVSKVSVAAGLDNSTIRKLLSGENASPKIETAERIASEVGYSLSTIIALGTNQNAQSALEVVSQFENLPADAQAELLRFLDYLRSRPAPLEPDSSDDETLPSPETTQNRGR